MAHSSEHTGRQSWTVGIMCYNEEGTIRRVVEQAIRVLEQIASAYEVLIVDDGSTDGTRPILARLQEEYSCVRLILHEQNRGIGHTLRSIYLNARHENVGNAPGDGQFNLEEYLAIGAVPEGQFVSFFRKENTSYTPFRNALSFVNKNLNRVAVGITLKDVNWTKIYKTADIATLDLQLQSSLVESEIAAKLLFLGRKVREVESRYLPRTHGRSKGASWATVSKALADTLTLVKILRNFRRSVGR